MNDIIQLNLSENDFTRLVNDAFKNYDSLLDLSRSPLAQTSLVTPVLILNSPGPDDYGRALRIILRWAVNRLAPEIPPYPFGELPPLDDPTWISPIWWRYNILRHHYLDPLPLTYFQDGDNKPSRVSALSGLMGISSEDAFFDERNRAIKEAARLIRIQLTNHQFDEDLRRIALEELYEQLTPDQRTILELAAIFQGDFQRTWLQEIAALEHLEIIDILDELIAHRLINEESDGVNLNLPAELQKYVHARQANSPQLRRRHEQAAQFYQTHHDPLQAAWHLEQSHHFKEAATILLQEANELINEFQARELRQRLEPLTLKQLPLSQWCDVQLLLSDLYRYQGEPENAVLACRRVIRATHDPSYQARSFHRLGKLYEDHGAPRALEYYRQAAERFSTDDPEWPGFLKDRGWLYIKIKEWENAKNDLYEALKHIDPTRYLQIADIQDAISRLYQEQYLYEEALSHAQQSLLLREQTGDLARIADSSNNMGFLYMDMKQYQNAKSYFEEALSVHQRLGNSERIANATLNIGAIYYWMNDYPTALAKYFSSLKIYQDIDLPRGVAQAYYNIAEAYVALHQIEEAVHYWQLGYTLSENTGLEDQIDWFNELKKTIPFPNETTENSTETDESPLELSDKEQQIIALTQQEGYITPKRLQQEGIPKSTATRMIAELTQKGILTKTGKGYYCLTTTLSPSETKTAPAKSKSRTQSKA